jgi:hypothetical protein
MRRVARRSEKSRGDEPSQEVFPAEQIVLLDQFYLPVSTAQNWHNWRGFEV